MLHVKTHIKEKNILVLYLSLLTSLIIVSHLDTILLSVYVSGMAPEQAMLCLLHSPTAR